MNIKYFFCLLRLFALTFLLAGVASPALAITYTDNGDGTVTDPTTNLTWMRCARGQTWTGSTCTGTGSPYNWDQANALTGTVSFAGKSDWRLPNIRELQSIVDRSTLTPAINATAFPNTVTSSYFWSASASTSAALYVGFSYGYSNAAMKTGSNFVRLVRGDQPPGLFGDARPTSDYVDHGDGTVTHTPTGLMWKRCAEGQNWGGTTCTGNASTFIWDDANSLTSTFAGKNDWHMPTEEELLTLVDYTTTTAPAINTTVFPGTQGEYFWSASPYVYSPLMAWYVYFGDVYAYGYYKSSSYQARLVRTASAPVAAPISNARLFTFVEANFPSIFTGAATAGQYLQYNYRYYPASGNILAVDTSGVIYVLGPLTGNVFTSVGPVESFRAPIATWETSVGLIY